MNVTCLQSREFLFGSTSAELLLAKRGRQRMQIGNFDEVPFRLQHYHLCDLVRHSVLLDLTL